jgi:hypothetical protein
MAEQCHKTERGQWECKPRTCTRWQTGNCPEYLVWALYKPRKDEDEPAPEHPET